MNSLSITSVTITGGGTGFTVEGTIDSDPTDFGIASRPVSIIAPAEGNADWVRTFRISEQGVSCKRFGVGAVIMPIAELAKLAVAVDPALTFPPTIVAQPGDVSYADEATDCTIECSWASELTPTTNKWEYAAWGGSSYSAWADVPTPDEADVTTSGVTVSTLTFTAGSGVYLDKTKFRKTIINTQGTLVTREALLTVT